MSIESENEHSDGWHGLASIAAGNRACKDLVEKYDLWDEMEALYQQYLPEEIEKLESGLH